MKYTSSYNTEKRNRQHIKINSFLVSHRTYESKRKKAYGFSIKVLGIVIDFIKFVYTH